MTRLCATCAHPERHTIEAAVLAGGRSLRLIALDFPGLNESSISRHVRNHTVRAIREQCRSAGADLHSATIATRLSNLADETSTIREQATASGDHKLALDAIRSEVSTVGALATRLGIDSDELLEQVQELRAFQLAAVGVLYRQAPHLLSELADALNRQGWGSLADDLDYFAERATEPHLALVHHNHDDITEGAAT